jgi:hypothetical protein
MDAPEAHGSVPDGWVGLADPRELQPPKVGVKGGGNSWSGDFHEETIASYLFKILWRQDKSRVGSWVRVCRVSLGRPRSGCVAIAFAPSRETAVTLGFPFIATYSSDP